MFSSIDTGRARQISVVCRYLCEIVLSLGRNQVEYG